MAADAATASSKAKLILAQKSSDSLKSSVYTTCTPIQRHYIVA